MLFRSYIRLNILVRDYLKQNVAVDAAKAAEGKKCRYCHMKVTRENESTENGNTLRLTVEEIRTMSPLDVARMYYRKQFSCEMDGDFEKMLEQVARELSDNSGNEDITY